MTNGKFTTVPLRCPACGQQTHKTLESVVQDGGFLCGCGARNELDIERFAEEIRKSDSTIKDFGRES
jgi:transcription elongation factor Elf1